MRLPACLERSVEMKFLERIPCSILVPLAILMGLAPFRPRPHLGGKINLLLAGTLTHPLDILDLFMHSAPAILLLTKFILNARKKG